MRVGTVVIFVEEQGDKGPQASTVRLAGNHRKIAKTSRA
jgi:putative Ca2+/H+ antiporter (TMEM165/GDT1 family)